MFGACQSQCNREGTTNRGEDGYDDDDGVLRHESSVPGERFGKPPDTAIAATAGRADVVGWVA